MYCHAGVWIVCSSTRQECTGVPSHTGHHPLPLPSPSAIPPGPWHCRGAVVCSGDLTEERHVTQPSLVFMAPWNSGTYMYIHVLVSNTACLHYICTLGHLLKVHVHVCVLACTHYCISSFLVYGGNKDVYHNTSIPGFCLGRGSKGFVTFFLPLENFDIFLLIPNLLPLLLWNYPHAFLFAKPWKLARLISCDCLAVESWLCLLFTP